MNKINLNNLLEELQEDGGKTPLKRHDKVLLIDGLNLFFRNFAILNMVNPNGLHIGGLGGFLRSLGALIRINQPTCVYVVFDGVDSSNKRKNLLPEYKSGREHTRITNWDAFNNIDEEHEAKINQIIRLIQYLKLLPIKVISIDKVEADDIISVLGTELNKKYNAHSTIVSVDKDFLQLINENITIYSPIEKEFYNSQKLKLKYDIIPENFIIYKTLLGDNSDKIPGIKGLGVKKLFKLFPELKGSKLVMDDLFKISKSKFKEHIIYARIIQDWERLKKNYIIMDLTKPLVSDEEISYINSIIDKEFPKLDEKTFKSLYKQDQLGNLIRNLDYWIKENFTHLNNYKN